MDEEAAIQMNPRHGRITAKCSFWWRHISDKCRFLIRGFCLYLLAYLYVTNAVGQLSPETAACRFLIRSVGGKVNRFSGGDGTRIEPSECENRLLITGPFFSDKGFLSAFLKKPR